MKKIDWIRGNARCDKCGHDVMEGYDTDTARRFDGLYLDYPQRC